THNELASSIGAFARRDDGPALHFHEAADDGESDPQAALRTIDCAIQLREQLEDAKQRVLRNAHAGVAHAQYDLVTVALGPYRDLPARLRIFGGVGQQVADDLRNARKIATQIQRRGWHVYVEHMPHRIDLRTARFNG